LRDADKTIRGVGGSNLQDRFADGRRVRH
jgi:hypothetical protein